MPVSYTHLDVYKRQAGTSAIDELHTGQIFRAAGIRGTAAKRWATDGFSAITSFIFFNLPFFPDFCLIDAVQGLRLSLLHI